jgi:hypothetical protein
LLSLAMLAAFIWFAVTVPLGKRTLVGHLRAISGSQEAKDLADGTRQEAEKVARKVQEELHLPDMAPTERQVHARQAPEPVDERERKHVDKLVKPKTRVR